MKRKRINRGAVLSAVAIVGVLAYCIGLAVTQHQWKNQLKANLPEFLQTYYEATLLPEAHRVAKPDMTKAQQEEALANSEKILADYLPDDKDICTDIMKSIGDTLSDQAKGTGVLKKVDCQFRRVDRCTVTGNVIYALVSMRLTQTFAGEETPKSSDGTIELLFAKTDAGWKLQSAPVAGYFDY